MVEVWKDIENYEGYYQVSNLGNVRSLDRKDRRGYRHKGKLKVANLAGRGYLTVCLYKNSKQYTSTVHLLVAKAFIKGYNSALDIDHIDKDKTNNNITNLRLITHQQNCRNMKLREGRKYYGVSQKGYYANGDIKYRARIKLNYRMIHIGYYRSELEAARAYNKKALEIDPNWGHLNSIGE